MVKLLIVELSITRRLERFVVHATWSVINPLQKEKDSRPAIGCKVPVDLVRP
jgi:hypothetical protein